MDPALRALAAAAENGAVCPYVRLLVDGMFVFGQPTRAVAFKEANDNAVQQTQWQAAGGGKAVVRKGEVARREQRYHQSMEALGPTLEYLGENLRDDSILTLVDAVIAPTQGDGLRIPAFPVELSAISGWWLEGARPIKADAGGGFWFVGGFVTTD